MFFCLTTRWAFVSARAFGALCATLLDHAAPFSSPLVGLRLRPSRGDGRLLQTAEVLVFLGRKESRANVHSEGSPDYSSEEVAVFFAY